jgi:hypothetical protein
MNRLILRSGTVAFLFGLAACSSGSPSGGAAPAGNAACADLLVLFNPMYTAYDGAHMFQIPAVADNIDPAAVTWSASDPSMVDLAADASSGGVMISARKAGTVKIIATAGARCGSSLLTITQATPDEWAMGNSRYNNGVALTGTVGGRQNPDAAPTVKDFACTNCHGPTATMGQFDTVSHTPEQTGGFSDDDLIGIFTKGRVPVNGYFDPSVVPYDTWRGFHTWDMSPQEAKGMVVYLRSLAPETQAGKRGSFGRRSPRDGGMGGVPGPAPLRDAGSATD